MWERRCVRTRVVGWKGTKIPAPPPPLFLRLTCPQGGNGGASGCASSIGQERTPPPALPPLPFLSLLLSPYTHTCTRAHTHTYHASQYKRILKVVRSHAIHYGDRGVTFICKKSTSATPDICSTAATVISSSSTSKESSSINSNIRTLFGDTLARDLLTIDVTRTNLLPADSGDGDDDDARRTVTLRGRISNPNYTRKKSEFIIFINNRLVDCRRIRRAVEATYTAYLPKKTRPFVYLSLTLALETVDVNVHPTKSDVHFLHEDEIVGFVEECVQKQLQGTNTSRTFMTQTLLVSSSSSSSSSSKKKRSSLEELDSGGGALLSRQVDGASEVCVTNNEGDDEDKKTTTRSLKGKGDQVVEDEKKDETMPRRANSRESRKRKHERRSNGVDDDAAASTLAPIGVPKKKKFVDPRKLIRTDSRATTLDAFVHKSRRAPPRPRGTTVKVPLSDVTASSETSSTSASADVSTTSPTALASSSSSRVTSRRSDGQEEQQRRRRRRGARSATRREVYLDSILSLRKEVESREHKRLTKLVRNAVYVGAVDRKQCLLQHETKLYLARHDRLSESFFYQAVLRDFSNLERIPIEPPLSVKDCLRLALDLPEARQVAEWQKQEGNTLDEVAQSGAELLAEKSDMLREYFGIDIATTEDEDEGEAQSHDGKDDAALASCALSGLPEILVGHCPTPEGLPLFLLELITEVDFTQERPCFVDVATCLARYYAKLPRCEDETGSKKGDCTNATVETSPTLVAPVSGATVDEENDDDDAERSSSRESPWSRALEHTLFPAIRQWLVAPRQYANEGVFVEVACLERLYRIFERC